jgi:hypothetical protein
MKKEKEKTYNVANQNKQHAYSVEAFRLRDLAVQESCTLSSQRTLLVLIHGKLTDDA